MRLGIFLLESNSNAYGLSYSVLTLLQCECFDTTVTFHGLFSIQTSGTFYGGNWQRETISEIVSVILQKSINYNQLRPSLQKEGRGKARLRLSVREQKIKQNNNNKKQKQKTRPTFWSRISISPQGCLWQVTAVMVNVQRPLQNKIRHVTELQFSPVQSVAAKLIM